MKKKTIIVIAILLIIGIAVMAALAFNKNQNSVAEKEKTKATESAKIPTVSAYYGDEKIGEINGYTMEMSEQYVRDLIVPIAPTRQMPIKIKANGNKIEHMSYEIKSTDDDRLIDSGVIEKWTEKGDKLSFTYEASAIMKPGTEYFLVLTVSTKQSKNIKYYTRAMVTDQEFVKKQIEFAKNFSDATFDDTKASKLANYIEPDLNLANDNLGQVTIQSSYAMLIWKTLKPEKIDDTQVSAKEFCIKDTGEAGTYTMTYQIKSTNAQNIEEIYNVAETITVWTCAGKQYVLAYEREVNQVWEANKNNVGNAFIDLGIQNITKMDHVESDNGQYIAFAINGDVYLMDIKKKEVTPLFLLDAKSSKGLSETRAKVIKVDDKGNVAYMIYGYSPAEQHVGKNGISIMQYHKEAKETVEEAFIPCTVPAALLQEQLSQLCYVGDGALYIMLDNTVYYVNLKTKEWGTLVANLEPGSYAVNESRTVIAYNTSANEDDSDSITVVDLTDGKKSTISAGEGEKITVYGYTGSNLVYGIRGTKSPKGKYNFFPVYKLEIVDENLDEIKSYSKDNVYITDVEITDNIINIKRWKNGKAIEDDLLLENTVDKVVVADSSYYNDDIKLKELALAFTNNLDASIDLTVEKQGKVTFDSNVEVNSKFETPKDIHYYVYGYGKLQDIFADKNQAIKKAREVYGLVTDENGHKIWTFEENYNN